MMRKFITALAVVALATTATKAQDIFDNPDNHAFWGLRVGYELSIPGDVSIKGSPMKADLFDSGSGFHAGVVYNLPVWKNLYFEPGATLFYNTYSLSDEIFVGDPDDVGNLELTDVSARTWGVRIPLLLGYNFDFIPDLRVGVFTGPEFSVAFKGKTHTKEGKYSVDGPLYGGEGYMNRGDIRWRFGVGVTYKEFFNFSISGAAGMCDALRDDLKMHTSVFDLTLGYNF